MNRRQHTILNIGELEGFGLHSGNKNRMRLKPAPDNFGIAFRRIDLENKPIIKVNLNNTFKHIVDLCFKHNNIEVRGAGHLLSAIYGRQVDNILIELEGEEIPFFDGSAKVISNMISKLKIQAQHDKICIKSINQVITYKENLSEIIYIPYDGFEVTTLLDYKSEILGSQFAIISNLSSYPNEIADAKSFAFIGEVDELIKLGILTNNNNSFLQNIIIIPNKPVSKKELERLSAIVYNKKSLKINPNGVLNNVSLKYSNEPARHKILDFLGYLTLVNYHIKGKFIVKRNNYSSTIGFIKEFEKHINMDMPKSDYEYDIALSFADEDREYVRKVAECLSNNKIHVFFDEYEKAKLWGKDLYQHLSEIYKRKCKYCIVFISKYYASKLWTNHELKSAQARAFEENIEYILPAKLDDTEIRGINKTIGYIDLSKYSLDEFCNLIIEKLNEDNTLPNSQYK